MQEEYKETSKVIKILKQVFKVIISIFKVIGKIFSVLWKIMRVLLGRQFTDAVENTVGEIRRGNGFS